MFNLGTAVGFLRLSAQGVVQGVNQAVSALNRLNVTSVRGSDASKRAYKENFFALRDISAAAGGLSLAVGAAFGKAISSSMDWESAMAGVQRTTYETARAGETMEQANARNAASLDALEGQLFDLASRKPIPTGDLAKIAEEAGALGIRSGDIAGFTSVIADLEATTDLTADVATSSLARIGNIMDRANPQYERMGSTILELGRSTAATEGEIVTMARRIAGAGKTIGLSTDQVLAYAAALASVGVREEQGGSAISRTFIDIQDAVSGGGEDLEKFASVAGMSADQFAQAWETNAGNATAAFISGLGQMQAGGEDVFAVLNNLGITEVRQRDALLRLASAQGLLNETLGTGASAFSANTALTEIANRRYATTAAQLAILKNQFFAVAVEVGDGLLPVMKLLVSILSAVATGLTAIPSPMRNVYAIGIGLIGIIGGLIAVITFVIPRMQAAAAALREMGVAGGFAATGLGVLQRSLGWITALLTLATVAIGIFGQKQKEAADDANRLADAQREVADAVSEMRAGDENAVRAWVVQKASVGNLRQELEALGITMDDVLNGAIAQAGSDQQTAIWGKFGQAVSRYRQQLIAAGTDTADAWEQAAEHYDPLRKKIEAIIGAVQDERTRQDALNATMEEFGIVTEDAVQAQQDLADATDEAIEKADKQNQAMLDLVEARRAATSASLALTEAQVREAEAADKLANKNLYLRDAENQLAGAQAQHLEAIRAVTEAEENLAEARQNSFVEFFEANLDLLDARSAQEEAANRIADAQEAVNDAFDEEEHIEDVTKAVHDLEEAYNNLKHATVDVEDAQWQLNYLLSEGASERDIRDARLALEDANLSLAQSEDDLIDAHESLADLNDPAERARDQRDATRELASAQRDAQRATIDIWRAENQLADARQAVVNDTAYRDALLELQQRQRDVTAAEVDVYSRTVALQAIQNGSIEREYAAVQLQLEDAYFRVASANVEVQRQMALARGETWTSAQTVQAMRGQLMGMSAEIGGPIGANMRNLAGQLNAVAIPRTISVDADVSGASTAISGLDDQMVEMQNRSASNLERFFTWLNDRFEWVQRNFSLTGLSNFFGEVFTLGAYEGHARGGMVTRPHLGLVGEAGPELILPLSDMGRTWQLLQESGLMHWLMNRMGLQGMQVDQALATINSRGGGGDGPVTNSRVTHGDEWNLSFLTQADPQQIASQIAWRQRTRRRK